MSVVFADLADFTTLSEQLDAEDVATIQDSWFALAAEAVTAAGATSACRRERCGCGSV